MTKKVSYTLYFQVHSFGVVAISFIYGHKGEKGEEYSLEELVNGAKTDDYFLALLIMRLMPMVMSRAAVYAVPGADVEDLAQEGLIGLISALHGYKPESGPNFITFAAICITRRIISARRSLLRQKHIPLNTSVREESAVESEIVGGNPEDLLIETEKADEVQEIIRDSLSELELRVFEMFLQGYVYSEIAGELHLSVKSVDNAIQRIRRKLKKRL